MASKKNIVDRLKDLRKKYDMSLEDFAAHLGKHLKMALTPAKLAAWEKGRGPASTFRARLDPILLKFEKHFEKQSGPATGSIATE